MKSGKTTFLSKRQTAMTMTEMLIIVVILVLLVAILVPFIVKSNRASNTKACILNAHQLAKAELLYAFDNSEQFAINQGKQYWLNQLIPYVDSPETIKCPLYHGVGSGYAINGCLSTLGIISQQPKVILFAETTNAKDPRGEVLIQTLTAPDSLLFSHNSKMAMGVPYGADRHGGGANYTFVDGHIEWLQASQFRLPSNNGCEDTSSWVGPKDGPTFWFKPMK